MSRSKPSSPTTSSAAGPSPAPFRDALAAAVAAAPTGIVVSDPNQADCPIVYANPAFFRLTGYRPDEVIGRNCRFLQGPGTDPADVEAIRRAIAARRPLDIEITNYRRDGTRFVNELHISPVFGPDGALRHFLGIQHDVTARERLARANQRARRAAERASTGKSDLLAFMSHEIRTPMTGVMGTVSLLLDTTLDAEQRAYAETARRCGETLLSTVNEMLDLSRMEAGRLALEAIPFALAAPVTEVLDLLGPAAAGKGLSLSAAIAPSLPARVVGDPQRLRQVLLNLADNAVKFTSAGAVTLRVEPAAQEGRIRFLVADTGVGIPPSVQRGLFRRFAQGATDTARRFGGSGLGLTIVKQLVALMGGRIRLDSAPGRGTVFSFDLALAPVAESGRPPATLLPAATPARPADGARGRILLAEDGEANQLVAAAILRKAGYAVDLARDGEEAVAAARTGTHDLVLMDLRMPRMDGFAATAAIRALPGAAGRVPILAMTAAARPGVRQACLDAGMDGHLAKPMDRAALLGAVAQALQSRPRHARASAAREDPALLDHATLDELRGAVGPGRLPRLIGVFAEETRARLARLAASEDLRALEEEAHGLKSAAGTFGASALREAAAALEAACLAGNRDVALAVRDGLPALVARSLAAYPASPGEGDAP